MRFWLWLPLVMMVGCEIDSRTEKSDASSANQPAGGGSNVTTSASNVTNSASQAEWDAIQWHTSSGPACPGAVQVMTLSVKSIGDGKVSFSWDRYPWSGKGMAHFFVWNGSEWSGGKFDWISPGGQSSKLLENIQEGYNGLSAPPSGTRVAFAWTNADGTQRSNLAYATWP